MSRTSDRMESIGAAAAVADLSRREALKVTLAAGTAAVVLTSRGARADDPPYPEEPPPEPTVCPTRPANSPPTTPFVQRLPIPLPAIPRPFLVPAPTKAANIAAGEAPRADHQRWNEFLPQVFYDVSIRPSLHQFHPEIPASYVWGFNGLVPGPTFLAYYHHPIIVRFRNDLPVDHTGFGSTSLRALVANRCRVIRSGHPTSSGKAMRSPKPSSTNQR